MSYFPKGSVVKLNDRLYIIIDIDNMIPIDSSNVTCGIDWAEKQSGKEIEFVADNVWEFIQQTFEKAMSLVEEPEKITKAPRKLKLKRY